MLFLGEMGEMDKDEEARVEWTDSSKRETTPVKLTAEQLVPDPPVTMRKRDWPAYYQADLVEAIGAEYIDLDPQPPPWVLNRRSSKRPKKGVGKMLQLRQEASESPFPTEPTIDSGQSSPRTTGAMVSGFPQGGWRCGSLSKSFCAGGDRNTPDG